MLAEEEREKKEALEKAIDIIIKVDDLSPCEVD